MNELIEKLAKQAGFEFDPRDRNFYHSDSAQYINNELKKFAELIVLECIRIGQETSKEIFKMSKKEGDIFEYESHGAEQVVDNIKEHFGVEE